MTRNLIRVQFVIVVIAIISLLVSVSNSFAASAKEDYELQERCGKRAEEFFKREYGSGISHTEGGYSMSGYINHYNKKLNKCFFLLTLSDSPYKGKNKSFSTTIELFDINEQNEYGNFYIRPQVDKFPIACKVVDKFCHSQAEWQALIKPYMEE